MVVHSFIDNCFVCRIYMPAAFILTFVIPIAIHYYLGEDPFRALNFNVLRYTLGLHGVWLVNSGAHKWGMRPYDQSMSASETYIVAYIALGEGWHNYHVSFHYDSSHVKQLFNIFSLTSRFSTASRKYNLYFYFHSKAPRKSSPRAFVFLWRDVIDQSVTLKVICGLTCGSNIWQ